MITVKSVVQASSIFGFLTHLGLTAGLVAVGYFDFLGLQPSAHSASALFQTVLSWNLATPIPVVQAIDSSITTDAVIASAVLSIVKLLARVSIASLLMFGMLLAYSFWPKRRQS
jgi:hypothetical protein